MQHLYDVLGDSFVVKCLTPTSRLEVVMLLHFELGSFKKSVMTVEVYRWIVTEDRLEAGVTHVPRGLLGP